MTFDPVVSAALDAAEEQVAGIEELLGDVDPDAVAPYIGSYTSETLGDAAVAIQDGTLRVDVGEFQSELRPILDETGAASVYLMSDPPLAGQVALTFGLDGGVPSLAVIDPATGEQYTFTFSTDISFATPSP